MKKIFIFAMTAATAVSCSKSEVTAINDEDPNTIKFDSYIGAVTKGSTTTDVQDQTVGIYAYKANSDFSSLYFDGEEVLTMSDGSWKATKTYYWPESGDVYFFAYHPALSDDGTKLAASTTGVVTSYPQISQNAEEHSDILIDKQVANSGTVSFSLDHALSLIDFKIITDDDTEVTINSFEIQGIESAHTGLDLENQKILTSETIGDESVKFDFSDSDKLYSYNESSTFTTPISITSGSTVTLSNETKGGVFLLLPQEYNSWTPSGDPVSAQVKGARIVINYTLKIDGEKILDNVDAAFPLPAITSGLQADKKYTYTLTFDRDTNGGYTPDPKDDDDDDDDVSEPLIDNSNKILFCVSVDSWGDESEHVI